MVLRRILHRYYRVESVTDGSGMTSDNQWCIVVVARVLYNRESSSTVDEIDRESLS